MEREPPQYDEDFEQWFFNTIGIPVEWAHGLLRMHNETSDILRLKIQMVIYEYEKQQLEENNNEQLSAN